MSSISSVLFRSPDESASEGVCDTAGWFGRAVERLSTPFRSLAEKVAVSNGVTMGPGAEEVDTTRYQSMLDHPDAIPVDFLVQDGISLEGMYFSCPDAKKAVLICSGAGHSHEFFTQPMVDAFLSRNVSVMVFNYRGFGGMAGKATEEGLYQDAEAAYEYLKQCSGFDDSQLVVWGYSLGSAPASYLSTRYPVDVVLDRPFATMSQVAYDSARYKMKLGPLGGSLARRIFRSGAHFDNVEKIKRAQGRVFLVTDRLETKSKRFNHHEALRNAAGSQLVGSYILPMVHIQDASNLWFGPSVVDADIKQAAEAVFRFIL